MEVGPRPRLVRLLAPSTARLAHIGTSSEMPRLRRCAASGDRIDGVVTSSGGWQGNLHAALRASF